MGNRIMDNKNNNTKNNDPQNITQKTQDWAWERTGIGHTEHILGMRDEDRNMTHGTYPGHERGGQE